MRRLPPYLFAQLNRLKYEKRRAGDDVIDLGMGNPSDPPQSLVIEKLAEAARDPKNHGYSEGSRHSQPAPRGGEQIFSSTWRASSILSSKLIACLGSKEGFSHLCLALLGPGDTAIVPAPSYPAHLYAVALASANAILLEVTDPQKLLANVDYTCRHMVPRPKVWIVNYPHNPSTTVVDPEFYVEAVKLAKQYGVMIISDLAYADVTFDGYKTPSILAASGGIDVAVELTTMSKGYNMAGWRIGFSRRQCRNGTSTVHDQGLLRLWHLRLIEIAAILALRNAEAAVEAQAMIYQNRRDVLCDGLERLGWPIQRPKASMFVWVSIPEPWANQMNSFDFSMKLLKEGDVAVSPGGGFGPAGEGHLRLALVENENRLRQAVRQIGRCLGK